VINVSDSRRNEDVLDRFEEFASGKEMSRSDSFFCLSEQMLIQMIKTHGGSRAILKVSPAVDRWIGDPLKRLPISQTKGQFVGDVVRRYIEDLKRKRYRFNRYNL